MRLPRRCAPRNDIIGYPSCHCETSAHTTRKGYAASVTLVPRERLRSGRGNLRLSLYTHSICKLSFQQFLRQYAEKIPALGACPKQGLFIMRETLNSDTYSLFTLPYHSLSNLLAPFPGSHSRHRAHRRAVRRVKSSTYSCTESNCRLMTRINRPTQAKIV